MEYTITDIDKINIGDTLVLDIDANTGSFPDHYSASIKSQSELLKAELAAYIFLADLKIRLLFKDKNFKKICVVVDNYKVEKAKNLLNEKGFILQEILPLTNHTTAIKFDVAAEEFEKKKAQVFSIMSVVDAHFNRRN